MIRIVFAMLLLAAGATAAPEDELAKEMTHDLEMNFNKIAPFGKEDTAKELQELRILIMEGYFPCSENERHQQNHTCLLRYTFTFAFVFN